MTADNNPVDNFITRWRGADGSELANAQSFTRELCELLGVAVPDPARADTRDNAYVFERRVIFNNPDGSTAEGRIDCYRRGAFVLESKKLKQGEHNKGFGVALLAAHKQAEQYARALPASESRPPFLLVVDVGNLIDIYAEFSRSGATYTPFPDPRSHRIKIDDLRDDTIRERLRAIWLDPLSLDPTRQSAKVTREIATQLAGIAKSLEAAQYSPERVGSFLTRCLFTFFAEDVGLLPKRSFTELLESLAQTPNQFVPLLTELWQAMDVGRFSVALRLDVLQFNGKLFKDPDVLPLDRDQIALLIEAGRKNWSQVEPAIFGTLLERALDPIERHALGAHYTPRAYVERLVLPTVIEPLREEWSNAQAAALTLAGEGKVKEAEIVLRGFQHRLCSLRVLDPACGSGNFLYVTMEHLKRLEGEVLNQLQDLNVSMSLETEGLTVDPHQFLGIELNPRAASIAEMVLWIGYLQWHFRTKGSAQPPQPVLRDFKNIENRDAVLAYDSIELLRDENAKPVTRWDGRTYKKHPVTGEDVPDEAARIAIEKYINPRKAEWPQADFVVGNPPFIGNKRMRDALGDGYVEALRGAWNDVPDTADFVMYWWDHAAEQARADKLESFGLITTNSLRQTFNRQITDRHLSAIRPLSLRFVIPDHPWVDNADGAEVRISMSVADMSKHPGKLVEVIDEQPERDGEIAIMFSVRNGFIQSDLTAGAKVSGATKLQSNVNVCFQGMNLVGKGFRLKPEEVVNLGYEINNLPEVIKPHCNARDFMQAGEHCFVIDFFGFTAEQARDQHPSLYQWLFNRVKPERDQNKDAQRKRDWWLFGRSNSALRSSWKGVQRILITPETSKHRVFSFIDLPFCPDHKLYALCFDDASVLGVLSSTPHRVWSLTAGGRLGVGNDPTWTNTTCFATYPFPAALDPQSAKICALAEQLDTHRKKQQAQHPALTLTGMYNVIGKLKSGETLTAKEKIIHEQGLVSVLKQLHDELDLAVLDAYGWSDLAPLMQVVNGNSVSDKPRADVKRELDETLLERLVALNSERAEEEKRGLIRWLRPEYQNPQGTGATSLATSSQTEMDVETEAEPQVAAVAKKQPWPKGDIDQVKAIIDVLATSKSPLDLDAIATHFTSKGAWKKRLPSILEMLVVVGKVRMDSEKYGMA